MLRCAGHNAPASRESDHSCRRPKGLLDDAGGYPAGLPCQSARHLFDTIVRAGMRAPHAWPCVRIRYRDFRHGGRNWRCEPADRLSDGRRATGLHRRRSLSRRLRRTCVKRISRRHPGSPLWARRGSDPPCRGSPVCIAAAMRGGECRARSRIIRRLRRIELAQHTRTATVVARQFRLPARKGRHGRRREQRGDHHPGTELRRVPLLHCALAVDTVVAAAAMPVRWSPCAIA